MKDKLKEKDYISIIDSFLENGGLLQCCCQNGPGRHNRQKEDSAYQPGIRTFWIKIKKSLTVDLVLGGYIPGKGNRELFFGGVLVGAST